MSGRLDRVLPPGAATTVLASAGTTAAGAIAGLLVARLLAPSGRGILAVCFVWVALLAQAVDCGLPQAIAYFSARDKNSASPVVGRALTAALPQTVVAVMFVLFLREHLISAPSAQALVLLAVAGVPAILVQSYVVGVLRGLERYRRMNLLRVLPTALWCVLVVVSYVGSLASPTLLIAAYVLVLWFSAILALLSLARAVGTIHMGLRGIGPLLRYGLVAWASGVGYQANARIDQFMLGALSTTAVLGVYAVAVGLASTLGVVSLAIGIVTLPQVAAASRAERTSVIKRNVVLTLAVTGAMAIIGFLLAPIAVSTLLGSEYESSVLLVRILLFAQVAIGGTQVLEEVFRGVGRPGIPAIIEGVGTFVTIVALANAIPRYGALAAAWTSLGVYWLVFLSLAVTARPVVRRTQGVLDTSFAVELRIEPDNSR